MISFIVPLQYKKDSFIHKRANELIDYFSNVKFDVELVLSDSSEEKLLVSTNSKVVIVNNNYSKNIYSPAISRNRVVEYTSKEYIFFLDVDLRFSEKFIELLIKEIHSQLINKKKSFIMLPCFYLNEFGTKYFEVSDNKANVLQILLNSYLEGDNKYVDRLAVNTSAIVMKKEYFLKIGMFSEEFYGHGGEDFELLHRLAALNPHSKKSDDYYYDKVEQFPMDYKGFRKYLAYYSMKYLFTDLVLVHKWHKREFFNSFYMKRIKNENILIRTMKNYDFQNKDIVWKSNKIQIEYKVFLNNLLLKNRFIDKKYIGFYKLKYGLIQKRPWSNKLRKLITRPRLFFSDMYKNVIRKNFVK